MLSKKLQKYLQDNNVKHEVVKHRKVYTAYDAAATMKVKLNEIAKSLLVKFNRPFIQGEKPYALVIVGADKNIDLKKLARAVSDWAVKLNKDLRLKTMAARPAGRSGRRGEPSQQPRKLALDIYNKVARALIPKEKELKNKLKIKPGAMAAFGGIYKLPVFIDRAFLKNRQVIFAGDSFIESVRMLVKDFQQLEQAMAANFAVAKKPKKLPNQKIKKTKKNAN